MMELLGVFLLMISFLSFYIAWVCFKLWKAEKKMTWKPTTCSKNAPMAVQFACAAEQKKWRDQVWEIATKGRVSW